MVRYILLIVFLVFCSTSGCTVQEHNRSANDTETQIITYNEKSGDNKDNSMLGIEELTISNGTLFISYKVKNALNHDIWICRDLDIHGNNDIITKIDKRVLSIKLYLEFPPQVLLYQTIRSRYVRLLPNKEIKGQITIELPAKNMSPFSLFPLGERSIEERDNLRLEIGYFDKLLGISDQLIEIVTDNEAIIDHVWEGKSKEKILEVEIELEDAKIPCYYESVQINH